MSSEQLRLDAALLESALRQGLSSEHPSLRGLFERRPAWAELLSQASGAIDLDPVLLERLRATEQGEDRRLVDELLAEVRQGQGSPSPWRAPRWLLAAAGFLVLAGATAWWQARPQPGVERVQTLGANGESPGGDEIPKLTCVPTAGAEDFGGIRWNATRALREGESYEVVVRSCAANGPLGPELLRDRIRFTDQAAGKPVTSWSPTDEQRRSLPDCVEFSVTWLDANDFPIASVSASVSRSQR